MSGEQITLTRALEVLTPGESSFTPTEYAQALTMARNCLMIRHEALKPDEEGGCPRCGSGEWMRNQDEADNNYCGQCGQLIDWEGFYDDT